MAARATDVDFLFFLDDDIVLFPDCLSKLFAALEADPNADFAYCNFHCCDPTGVHPKAPYWIQKGQPWDPARLRAGNYISTMSLIRRESFLGFDESLARFQDWDYWLRAAEDGQRGVWVDEELFLALWLPGPSITKDVDYAEARRKVVEKHGL